MSDPDVHAMPLFSADPHTQECSSRPIKPHRFAPHSLSPETPNPGASAALPPNPSRVATANLLCRRIPDVEVPLRRTARSRGSFRCRLNVSPLSLSPVQAHRRRVAATVHLAELCFAVVSFKVDPLLLLSLSSPPPPAAVRCSAPPPARVRASLATGSRSDEPDLNHPGSIPVKQSFSPLVLQESP
jgi:hypothetical protein